MADENIRTLKRALASIDDYELVELLGERIDNLARIYSKCNVASATEQYILLEWPEGSLRLYPEHFRDVGHLTTLLENRVSTLLRAARHRAVGQMQNKFLRLLGIGRWGNKVHAKHRNNFEFLDE